MRKLFAEMWWCGDEICDCTQPQIVERSTVSFRHPAWKGPIVIEQGDFHSQADRDECVSQWDWLIEAAKRHKVANLEEIVKEREHIFQ